MNKKEIAELLQYCSPNSILVCTYFNKLATLYCPFKVLAREDVGGLKRNRTYQVTAVKLSTNLKTVFIINNQAYFYNHFDIIV